MTKTGFTKETASKASIIGWRNRRGIKIVVRITPFKKGSTILSRAVAEFERKIYVAMGNTKSLALKNLFSEIDESLSTLQTNE